MKHFLALVSSLLLSTSCFTVVHDYNGRREVTPGTKLTRPSTKIGNVSGGKKAKFLFWGLMDLNTASGPELVEEVAVQNHGAKFDGLTRVHIYEEQDALDVIVEVLTLGIFSMVTVEADAEVHRYAVGSQ